MHDDRSLFPETSSREYGSIHARDSEWVESVSPALQQEHSEYLGSQIPFWRSHALFSLIAISVLMFLAKTGSIQLLEGKRFASLAERNKIKRIVLPPHRGSIVDTKGVTLATNEPSFGLLIHPVEFIHLRGNYRDISDRISRILGGDAYELTEQFVALRRDDDPLFIVSDIPREAALQLIVLLAPFAGIEVASTEKRHYATEHHGSISHVTGYVGAISQSELKESSYPYHRSDRIGKDGIEQSYEEWLRGRAGYRDIEVDALGVEKRIIREEAPLDGESVKLTIDSALTTRVEGILRRSLKEFGKKKGVVIVSHPGTGEVRAMVSLPAYDANMFSAPLSQKVFADMQDDPDKPLFHRALRGGYPSGSTIKPLIAVAGLQEHIMTPSDAVVSRGGIRIGEWFFPDWKPSGHGRTDLSKAIAESVNTYFYMVGGGRDSFHGLGVERIITYMRMFGFGEKTGIDLPFEGDGFIPSPAWKLEKNGEPWYIGDTYHLAIGQGDIIVTPLQIHSLTSFFANGGRGVRPTLVSGLVNDRESEQASFFDKKQVQFRVPDVEARHIQSVRQGLRAAVEKGSARRLSLLPVAAAGKTGTAQWHTKKSPHAWFTGWAPFENPSVVITVLIEEGEEGSHTAVRVAYEILQYLFKEKK